jgi:hypothetical protein
LQRLFASLHPVSDAGRHYIEGSLDAILVQQGSSGIYLAGTGIIKGETNGYLFSFRPAKGSRRLLCTGSPA